MLMMILRVAASTPTVKSSTRNYCIMEGQNITLSCKVTYNGTNLMPLVMQGWKQTLFLANWTFVMHNTTMNVTNSSSVFRSSWTFSAEHQIDFLQSHWCRVTFATVTGLVLPGVEKQYTTTSGIFESAMFYHHTVHSKTILFYYFRLYTVSQKTGSI